MARPKKGKFGFSEKYSFRPILSEKIIGWYVPM